MADETTNIEQQDSQELTPQQQGIQFEDILPWGTPGGDTGLSSRLKLKRNFEKIKAWMDSLDLSALTSDKFLSKKEDDAAEGLIGFLKGIWIGIKGVFGWDAEGNIKANDIDLAGELRGIAARLDKIQSSVYTGDGMADVGFLLQYINGRSKLVVDDLVARGKFTVNELEVRKWTYAGGNMVFSGAGSIIHYVEYLDADGVPQGYTSVLVPWTVKGKALLSWALTFGARLAWAKRKRILSEASIDWSKVVTFRCYILSDDGSMQTRNWWQVDDQARCETLNKVEQKRESSGAYSGAASNTLYWRRVTGIGSKKIEALEDNRIYDYVDLSVTDHANGYDDIPAAGDSIVQFGNRTDTSRQTILTIEVVGDERGLKIYDGVNGYDLTGKRKSVIGPDGVELYARKFVIETDYGVERVPMDRGSWEDIPQHRCYYYDRVAHNGSLWLCIYPEGMTPPYTTEEPSDTAVYWRKQVSHGRAYQNQYVFKRSATKPVRPGDTDGYFNNPVPQGWSDGVPAGTDTIWTTHRLFTSDGQGQDLHWSDVGILSDTESFDVEFSPSHSRPAAPTDANRHGGSDTQVWFDPSLDPNADWENMWWMASRTKVDGIWGEWQLSRIKGEDGAFVSTVFCRTNSTPSTPTGGSYAAPWPDGKKDGDLWHDGIPSGDAQIWESKRTFHYTEQQDEAWSPPRPVSDTADLDIEFSPSETEPAESTLRPTPGAAHPSTGIWYDPSNLPSGRTMIWRAERKIRNGAYDGKWVISRIYGEKGETGTQGVGYEHTDQYYYATTTDSAPAFNKNTWSKGAKPSNWNTTNKFLWCCEVSHKTDGSEEIGSVYPVGVYSKDGTNGKDGKDGKDGTSVSIASDVQEFAVSTSGTVVPTSGWKSSMPAAEKGKFLWTRDTTTYSDGKKTVTYGVSYWGTDGTTLDKNRSYIRYSTQKTSSQPADSTFTLVNPPALSKGDWLWIMSLLTYSDGTVLKSYSTSYAGSDGAHGDKGADGYTTHFAYATSADGSQNFSVTPYTGATYIGSYRDQVAADSTNYRSYTWTQWKGDAGKDGKDGKDGTNGTNGKDGANGKDGKDGADGYTIDITPSSLIFNQADSGSLDNGNYEAEIVVYKGSTRVRLAAGNFSQKTTSHCGAYVRIDSATGKALVGFSSVETYKDATLGKNVYYDTGYAQWELIIGTLDIFVRVNWYANLKATYKESISNGVKTEVAQELSYGYDPGGSVHSLSNIGEYLKSAEENVSTLQTTVNGIPSTYSRIDQTNKLIEMSVGSANGKMLIPVGSWVATNGNAIDRDEKSGRIGSGSSKYAISPIMALNPGTYCLSFYDPEGLVTSFGIRYSTQKTTSAQIFNSGSRLVNGIGIGSASTMPDSYGTRYYYVFTVITAGYYVLYFYDENLEVYYPMVEAGSVPKATEQSLIKATSDKLSLGINNGLKKTGIDITKGKIRLSADKTEVDGNLTVASFDTKEQGGYRIRIEGGHFDVYNAIGKIGLSIGWEGENGDPYLILTNSDASKSYKLTYDGVKEQSGNFTSDSFARSSRKKVANGDTVSSLYGGVANHYTYSAARHLTTHEYQNSDGKGSARARYDGKVFTTNNITTVLNRGSSYYPDNGYYVTPDGPEAIDIQVTQRTIFLVSDGSSLKVGTLYTKNNLFTDVNGENGESTLRIERYVMIES